MPEDTLEPINAELQKIEEHLTELIQYMDSDKDTNDLTKALNHVRAVKYRLYGTWF